MAAERWLIGDPPCSVAAEDCRMNTTYCQVYLSGLFEEFGELRGVVHGLVPVAVVHQEMDLLRPPGHPADLRKPLLELFLLVGVVEAFRGGEPGLLPVLGVAAVEAHDRERVVRHRRDRRHARRKTLRLVD